MASRDVIVVVQRDALPKTKETLDILLISTTGVCPVDTYRELEAVEAVFGDNGTHPNAKIFRKATTLFTQGKTTLADTLVSKVKIVGFAPPSTTAATAAEFAVTVENVKVAIEKDATVYVKIGGDENAKVELTATAKISSSPALAALFKNATFTKGGKTYKASVDGNVVTFKATVAGATDTIPALVNIYTDAAMSKEANTEVSASFTNGTNTVSVPDNLIKTIKQFQSDEDNDWYYFMADRDEPEYVKALAKFAEASEPTEAELGAGVEDHRKFYMGQTSDKTFASETARAAVIYADADYLNEEPDASYTGNVAPFYPNSVTWKFKRPQDGNADTSEGIKLITLPKLTEGERDRLLDNHVNFLTEEYKRQYVKEGVCLNGEFIDVVLGGDWIAKRMRDLLYDLLLANANINYDDAGFGFIATAVLQTLDEAVDYNIIARDAESSAGVYTVNIPKYEESTEEQRRNRRMPDITWEALLAGAIHQVKVKGALRASL